MGGISWKEAQLLPSKMAYFKLLILLVPGILGQTHFKKCKGSSDLCFDAKLEKIEVTIGTMEQRRMWSWSFVEMLKLPNVVPQMYRWWPLPAARTDAVRGCLSTRLKMAHTWLRR